MKAITRNGSGNKRRSCGLSRIIKRSALTLGALTVLFSAESAISATTDIPYQAVVSTPVDSEGKALELTPTQIFQYGKNESYKTDANQTHYFTWGVTGYTYKDAEGILQTFDFTGAQNNPNMKLGSYTTLDLNGADRTFSGVLNNGTVLKLTDGNASTSTLTLTDATLFGSAKAHSVGTVWLDNVSLTWAPTTKYNVQTQSFDALPTTTADKTDAAALRLYSVYGNGTVANKYVYTQTNDDKTTEVVNKTFISGVVSPSFWSYETEKDKSGAEVKPAAVTGQTLTFSGAAGHTVVLQDEAILAPIQFDTSKAGYTQQDAIVVNGKLEMGNLVYIQPTFAEGNRDAEKAAETTTVVTATEGISYQGVQQKYAWGDATPSDFGYDFRTKDSKFSNPVCYSIIYNDDSIGLKKEFTWNGNYLHAIDYFNSSYSDNIYQGAWLFNELLYQGTSEDRYICDDSILVNVAYLSKTNPSAAAYYVKQFMGETYATRKGAFALSGMYRADEALEQFASARQFYGLDGRLGRLRDGECPDTEKRQNYDPFFAQFHGPRSWYMWATPLGQWLEQDTDSLLSGHFGYKYRQTGFNAGIGRTFGNVSLGFSGGWQDGEFSAQDTYHDIDTESFQTMLMATWKNGNWFVEGWTGYSRSKDSSQRSVLTGGTYDNPLPELALANYSLQGWFGGFTLGYTSNAPFAIVTPTIGLRFSTAINHEFGESNTGLKFEKEHMGLYEIPLGVRLTNHFHTRSGWTLVPMAKAEWIARFGDKSSNLTVDYSNYLSTITGGEAPNEFRGQLKLNGYYQNYQIGCEYSGGFGSDYTAHRASVTAGVTY